VARLGQPLYEHRDPNGYPETGDAWINTGSILARINFGLAVAAGRLPGAGASAWARAHDLERMPLDAQVDAVIRALLGGEASPDTRKVLGSGVNPLLAAADSAPTTDADAPPAPTARRARRRAGPPEGVARMVGLALGSPEFQRR
ncbi:MAG TPA: DUF1800 family protein, partial [Gemmatimonadaceae bacterium]